MKKYLTLITLICLVTNVFSQNNSANVPSDAQKTVDEQKIIDLIENGYAIEVQNGIRKNTSFRSGGGDIDPCNCWIEPDDTYTEAVWENGFLILDDQSTGEIDFDFDFDLFGEVYNSFFININGNITFDNFFTTFTPVGFPFGEAMLAPYWADVDLGCGTCGTVFYKVTDEAVFVNWVGVGYFNEQSDLVNSFQVVFTPSDSDVLPLDNTVQFCYGDMQWATSNGGFGGAPSTVGANEGNNEDFIQFGRFDEAGVEYDGPFGDEDGVDWLDNQTINFNANISANENLPPLPIGSTGCDSLVLCANDTEILDFTFLGPENNQNMTVTVIDDGFPDIETDITSGSPANATITLTSGLDSGEYDIEIIVTDDGVPAASTSIIIHVEVIAIELPDLEITSEGEILESITYCQSEDGALLSASDGFDSYEWSNGNSQQSAFFQQGQYSLTAYFMGCDSEAGPVSVFEIPVFNPDVSISDLFLCDGDSTEISIDNPEDYQSVEWTVYNMDGEIISDDVTADTITVTPGFYEVLVVDSNDCPGSRIVPIVEEIVQIPNTNFAPLCDDNEISWSGAWADPEVCAHFIYMTDSENDTWEGANIQVFIDGTGPFNFSIQNAFGFVADGITPYHGQIIEYFWTPGIDDDDINFQLFDGNNQVVFDTNEDDEVTEGLFFSQIADCGFNALPGTWVVDSPPGGEDWTLEESTVFNPVEGSNTFTSPAGFVGTYTLTFESDVCDSDISFPLDFSTSPTVTGIDYNACGEVTIEPTYGPENLQGDLEYNWTPNLNDGFPTATVTQSLTYEIEVSNSCGEDSHTGNVVITPIPTAELIDLTLCDSQTAELDPGNNADATYSWSDGSQGETLTINSGGTFSVEISNECGTANSEAVVTQLFSPTVQTWGEFDTLICAGTEIIINPAWNNFSAPAVWTMSYTDDLGNTVNETLSETGAALTISSSDIPDGALNNSATISYSSSNSCGTASGQILAYTDACFISATNVISPDSDGSQAGQYNGGLNEGWYVYGIDGVPGIEVKIYDRWGGLVFESDNYSNQDPWKGNHQNGSELAEGVYFYIVRTPLGNKEINGSITLLRQ